MSDRTRFCARCGDQFSMRGRLGAPRSMCYSCNPPKGEGPALVTKACATCGVSFRGSRTKRYCCAECRNSWHAKQTAERRAKALAAVAGGVKRCSRCDQDRPLDHFRKDRGRLDGRYPWCVDCWREYVGSEPARKAPPKTDYDRAYRLQHKDRIKDEWFSGYLWTMYRITEDRYNDLFEQQQGRCAICGTTDPGAARGRINGRFAVDHDHSCCPGRGSCGDCVRGLLCRRCNMGLGHLRDDVSLMRAAISYLEGASRGRAAFSP